MGATLTRDTVPAGPFIAWLNARLEALGQQQTSGSDLGGPNMTLAAQLGIHERVLNRYLRGVRATSRDGVKGEFPVDAFPLAEIENALHHADVPLGDVYPELDTAPVEVVERYCEHCREQVSTATDLVCPWCEHPTVELGDRVKSYCRRCDRMTHAAQDGTCWRCGTPTAPHMPWDACGCGCGAQFARFDHNGRRRRWVLGHAPKAHLQEDLDPEPFGAYLEQALRDLDPVHALAIVHRCSRDTIMAALNRRGTVSRDVVMGALRSAGMQGTGMPWKPGVPTFAQLYPDNARKRTCPDCGGGKAPQSARCKNCAVKHYRDAHASKVRGYRLRDAQVDEAWRLHTDEGLTLRDVAALMLPQTPYRSAGSLAHTLSAALRQRGRMPQRGRPLPDALVRRAWDMHQSGMSVTAVAQHLHAAGEHPSATTLRNGLYREFAARGLQPRRGPGRSGRVAARLPDELVLGAWELHDTQGISVVQIAKDLAEQGAHPNATTLRNNLYREFAARGLKPRRGRPGNRGLPDALVDRAWDMHQTAGMSVTAVAQHLHAAGEHPSETTLRNGLYREFAARGLQPRRSRRAPLPQATLAQAYELHARGGLSVAQAAARVGVPAAALRADLRSQGYELRRGRAPSRSESGGPRANPDLRSGRDERHVPLPASARR